MEQDALATQLCQVLERYANEHGVEATLAQVHACLRTWQERQRRGRPMIDDQERLALMARHLVEDADLIGRRRQGDGNKLLAEAARRALRELPAANDLDKAGEATSSAVRRVVRKFPFFSFDDPKRGFDRGLWLA
jgi:hypothetical protein